MLYSNVKIDYSTVNMAHPSDKKKRKYEQSLKIPKNKPVGGSSVKWCQCPSRSQVLARNKRV